MLSIRHRNRTSVAACCRKRGIRGMAAPIAACPRRRFAIEARLAQGEASCQVPLWDAGSGAHFLTPRADRHLASASPCAWGMRRQFAISITAPWSRLLSRVENHALSKYRMIEIPRHRMTDHAAATARCVCLFRAPGGSRAGSRWWRPRQQPGTTGTDPGLEIKAEGRAPAGAREAAAGSLALLIRHHESA